MLGKLLKLDITFGWKKFAALAGAVILAGIVIPLLAKVAAFGGTLLLIIGVLIIGVLSIYTCVQYFRNNLFGSEGYLMFTLPVKSGSIILSKLVTTVLWFNLMFCAAGVAMTFIMGYTPKEFIDVVFRHGTWRSIIQILLWGNMIGIPVIASVYLAVSSTNITVKNRPLNGIIAALIAVICIWVAVRASIWAVDLYQSSKFYESYILDTAIHGQPRDFMIEWLPTLIGFCVGMLFTAVYSVFTNLIIKKKLNLK